MPRRKVYAIPDVAVEVAPSPPAAELKKQSAWSRDAWGPGMIPNRSLRTVHSGPAQPAAYGEGMGIRRPMRRGTIKGGY